MIFNFELILSLLVLVSGLFVAYDYYYRRFGKRAKMLDVATAPQQPTSVAEPLPEVQYYGTVMTKLVEYAKSFFPVLLIVLLLRSFLVEPFRIPTGSLEPTLLIGDFILVNKYDYGLRLPVFGTEIAHVSSPKRGDIMVFRYPNDPSVNFIKRVIGLPGDHISYTNKVLSINGKTADQVAIPSNDPQARGRELKEENLFGVKHKIYLRDDVPDDNFYDVVVPAGHYFVMGDNRDESNDSRGWGYVPDANLVGKALFIWMSVNSEQWSIRWDRIGKAIH